MKQLAKAFLSLEIQDEKIRAQLKAMGVEDDDLVNQMIPIAAMFKKAAGGSERAAEVLMEMTGDCPGTLMRQAELRQRKAEFEYQKKKDAEAGDKNDGTLQVWIDTMQANTNGEDGGQVCP